MAIIEVPSRMDQFVGIDTWLTKLTPYFRIYLLKMIITSPRCLCRVEVAFFIITGFPAQSFLELHHVLLVIYLITNIRLIEYKYTKKIEILNENPHKTCTKLAQNGLSVSIESTFSVNDCWNLCAF